MATLHIVSTSFVGEYHNYIYDKGFGVIKQQLVVIGNKIPILILDALKIQMVSGDQYNITSVLLVYEEGMREKKKLKKS